jgi:hypothetical protein
MDYFLFGLKIGLTVDKKSLISDLEIRTSSGFSFSFFKH